MPGEREGIDPLEGGTAKQRDMAEPWGKVEGVQSTPQAPASPITCAPLTDALGNMCSSHQCSGDRFSSGRIRKSDESCCTVDVE